MKILLLCFIFLSSTLLAQDIKLENITANEFEEITKEFSANFLHTSVGPAAGLGDVWGIEVGLVAGITDTPELEKLVKQADPSSDVSRIPHASLLGAVTFPYSLTAEVSLFPEVEIADVSLETYGLGLKWTFSDLYFEDWPLDLALKAHFAASELSYKQNFTSGGQTREGTVSFDTTVYGVMLMAGSDFFGFLEPYAGIGYVKSDSEVGVDVDLSNVSIFAPSFTSASSAETDNSSAHFLAGVQFDLWIMHIAAEFASAFGTQKLTSKFSFYF